MRPLLSLLLAAVLCSADSIPAKDRILLLISLDGFGADVLADPHMPVPNLRRLASEGAVASRMTTSNPTVTWPNHTTMVTGVYAAEHGVLYNGLLVRGGPGKPVHVEPWRDKSELVRVPTIYDLAHQAGLTTAEVDWVAIQNAPTITWSFAERPDPKARIPRELVEAGVISAPDVAAFHKHPITWRDQIWTQAASQMIEKHRPNLLLFHLLNTDTVQHRYGPRTLAAASALSLADARVGDLLRALERARMLDRTTILVVADHGFKQVTHNIKPNALLRREGLLRAAGGEIHCDAYVVPEGGTAMVYVTAAGDKAPLARKLKEIFSRLEAIAGIFEPKDYEAMGFPDPVRNGQMADLVLAAKAGYSFTAAHDGDTVVPVPQPPVGSHGYVNTDREMDAVFVAWGYGIRRGARLDRARNIDIAPTIARLLGLKMDRVKGRALDILAEESR